MGIGGHRITTAIVTDASRARQLHQRGRRRWPGAVSAQRHGAVAAQRDVRQFERDGHAADLATLLDQAAAAPTPPAVIRRRRPAVPATGRHAGAHRAWYRRTRLPAPARPARDGARDRRKSRRGVRFERATPPPSCPERTRRRCTSSAAGHRTRCCASSPRTVSGFPVLAGPVEATAFGNVLLTGPRRKGPDHGGSGGPAGFGRRYVPATAIHPAHRGRSTTRRHGIGGSVADLV